MAILFADGFDHYGTASTSNTNLSTVYTFPSGALGYLCTAETTQSRTGVCSLRWAGYGWGIMRSLTSAKTKLGQAGWFRITTSKLVGLFSFNGTGNNSQIGIWRGLDGAVYASRADDSSVYGTTDTNIFPTGAWVHVAAWVEAGSSPSATDGKVIIRIGGASGGITVTCNNVDTLTGSNTNYVSCTAMQSDLGSQQDFYLDDFVINDDSGSYNNAIMDAYRAYAIYPNADTSGNDFVPASGFGYDNIDNVPPADSSSYIQSDTVADVSDFGVEDPSYALSSIAGVVVHSRMLTASSASVRVSCEKNGSVTAGSVHTLSGSGTYYQDVFERNPDGNAAWIYSTVGDSKIRFTRTA